MKDHFCNSFYLPQAQSAVGVIRKFWNVGQMINIYFINGTEDQQAFVEKTSVKWLEVANLHFNFTQDISQSDVRITFNEGLGAWSYLGTDNLNISKSNATMNFGWLDEAVVLHEFGHMLGLAHEHQNPNKAIQWNREAVITALSGPPNNWTIDQIEHNVFSKYVMDEVTSTEVDPDSIMMYFFPSSWTVDGFATHNNEAISPLDGLLVSKMYPKDLDVEIDPTFKDQLLILCAGMFPTRIHLSRLKESSLVELGQNLGLDVSIKDRKRHTVDKICALLQKE